MSWWKRNKEIDVNIDIDPNSHFVKYCQLLDENSEQYEKEAALILKDMFFVKFFGRFKASYSINDNEGLYVLFDTTSNHFVSGVSGPLPARQEDQIEEIKYLLCHSEASAVLESELPI